MVRKGVPTNTPKTGNTDIQANHCSSVPQKGGPKMTRKVASPIATTPNIRNTNIHATGDDELMKGGPNMNRKIDNRFTDRYLPDMVGALSTGPRSPPEPGKPNKPGKWNPKNGLPVLPRSSDTHTSPDQHFYLYRGHKI